jgi:hypothetical protein
MREEWIVQQYAPMAAKNWTGSRMSKTGLSSGMM